MLCIYGNSLLFLVVVVVVVISSQLLTHRLTNPCFFERMLDITIKDYCFYTIQSKRPATKCLFNYTCSISLSPAQNTYLPDRKTPWQWRAELFWLLLNFPLHQSIHRLFAVTGWYCLQTVFVFHPPFSATLFFHFQKHTSRTRKHHGSLSGSRRGLTSLLNSSEKITYWLTNSPAFAINPWLVLNQYLLYTCHILGIFRPFSLTGSTTAISWTEALLVITCCFFGCCCQRNSYSLACPPCCQPGSADSI